MGKLNYVIDSEGNKFNSKELAAMYGRSVTLINIIFREHNPNTLLEVSLLKPENGRSSGTSYKKIPDRYGRLYNLGEVADKAGCSWSYARTALSEYGCKTVEDVALCYITPKIKAKPKEIYNNDRTVSESFDRRAFCYRGDIDTPCEFYDDCQTQRWYGQHSIKYKHDGSCYTKGKPNYAGILRAAGADLHKISF